MMKLLIVCIMFLFGSNSIAQQVIRVINREAVMLSTEGYMNNFPTNEGPKSIMIVETVLIEKIDGKWVITVGHESTREDLENI